MPDSSGNVPQVPAFWSTLQNSKPTKALLIELFYEVADYVTSHFPSEEIASEDDV